MHRHVAQLLSSSHEAKLGIYKGYLVVNRPQKCQHNHFNNCDHINKLNTLNLDTAITLASH